MRRVPPSTWLSLPVRLAAINFFYNAAFESAIVYLALYARSLGASNLHVGYIAAGYGVALLVSSFVFGRLSDTFGRVKFIRVGLGLAALSYFCQFLANTPWTLLASRVFLGFSNGMNISAIMAYTYEQQKRIGGFISFGALGWLSGALMAALVRTFGTIYILSAVTALVAFLLALTLREDKELIGRIRVAAFPVKLITGNYKVLLGFLLRQIGAMAIWSIWPLYMTSLGASRVWISMIDVTNMVGQFITMRIADRFNPARTFRLGLILAVVTFAIYGLFNDFRQVFPVQLLLAVSYATLFIGGLNYLLWRHHEHGTVSGLMNSTNSLANSLGPFLGGAVSQNWGYPAVMFMGAGLAFLGLLTSQGLSYSGKIEKTELQAR